MRGDAMMPPVGMAVCIHWVECVMHPHVHNLSSEKVVHLVQNEIHSSLADKATD